MDAESKFAHAHVVRRLAYFISGAALCLLGVQLITTWLSICGASAESQTALCTVIAIASVCQLRVSFATSRPAIVIAAYAAAICFCSVTLAWSLNALLTLGASLFDTVPLLSFCLPSLLAGLITFGGLHWFSVVSGDETPTTSDRWITVSGMACGLCLPLMHGATQFAAFIPVTIACLGASVCGTVVRGTSFQKKGPAGKSPTHVWLLPLPLVVSGIGFGAWLIGCLGFASALMPITLPVVLPAAALLIVVLMAVESFPARSRLVGPRQVAAMLLLPSLIPVLFDRLVTLNLEWNATIDSVSWLFLLRGLQLALMAGAGAAAWLSVNRLTSSTGLTMVSTVFVTVGVTLAGCFSAIGAFPGWLMGAGLMAVALSLFVPSAEGSDSLRELNSGARRVLLASALFAVLIAALAPFDAARATQLLFSSRASQAFRTGMTPDVIAQSTGFRLLEEQRNSNGHLTVWRTSGDQVLLRRNGIPIGQVSTNTHTTPQPIADTLPVLLPLVMHQNASSILLIGDETGEGLRLCSDFPLHTILAVRPDSGTTAFAKNSVWSGMETPVSEDERIRIIEEPVSVAIRQTPPDGERFDVVAAISPNPTSVDSLEQLTPEFYERVREQLSDDGIFCQRITRHDVGAAPLVRMISAVSQHFGRVAMIHMAAGEIALVASVQPDSLLDSGLLSRLQRDHVANVLSRSGWDWSQVAALPVVDTNDPVGIFEHQERLPAASATNLHFAFSLPIEAAAWTDKAAELRQVFAPHQQRLADAAQRNPADYQEFARRFSAVVQQSEILSTFPDQPWPYRRSLRTEMQRNSRPAIEHVRDGSLEKTADPRDEHRKDYFVTLGQVLQQASDGPVDPMSLRQLAAFTNRYEPLLSYFAHHELIRIHEATGHPSPALELRHRLHTVYFTEGSDFSIRQLVTAIEQILDDPELITDASARFDHVNSMLQELVRRWELRRNYDPPSARQTQNDVDACIAVAKRGIDALFQWAPEVGVATDDITARRIFINRALVSPLRSYHETVLAHRARNEAPLASESDDVPLLLDPADILTD